MTRVPFLLLYLFNFLLDQKKVIVYLILFIIIYIGINGINVDQSYSLSIRLIYKLIFFKIKSLNIKI